MEVEVHLYRGDWDEAVRVAEESLPLAWEIREWNVVVSCSAWLAIAHLKLGQPAQARCVLDRLFNEVPARALAFGVDAFMMAIAQTALAQLHITFGDLGQALSAAQQALTTSLQCRAHLEEGAAHRVLGRIYEAMGNRAEADAAFRRSLEILGEIQSRPELAQTLLAYGRFRRGHNSLEDRAVIERALRLFEEMGATGW